MNVLAGVLRLWGPLLPACGGEGGCGGGVGGREREVGSISCNGQAISAENIYNFLSI